MIVKLTYISANYNVELPIYELKSCPCHRLFDIITTLHMIITILIYTTLYIGT